MTRRLYLVLLSVILLCSCESRNQNRETNHAGPGAVPTTNQGGAEGGGKMTIKVTSTAFTDGGMIPKQYTCDGPNISPPLAWDSIPDSAKTVALIADDPDAPVKTWVHWVVFDLPAGVKSLPENISPQAAIPGGGKQGTNDFGKIAYGGPCPPSGTHRYYFKLYAVDKEVGLDSKTTKDQLLRAIEGHVLAQGQLMGKYKR